MKKHKYLILNESIINIILKAYEKDEIERLKILNALEKSQPKTLLNYLDSYKTDNKEILLLNFSMTWTDKLKTINPKAKMITKKNKAGWTNLNNSLELAISFCDYFSYEYQQGFLTFLDTAFKVIRPPIYINKLGANFDSIIEHHSLKLNLAKYEGNKAFKEFIDYYLELALKVAGTNLKYNQTIDIYFEDFVDTYDTLISKKIDPISYLRVVIKNYYNFTGKLAGVDFLTAKKLQKIYFENKDTDSFDINAYLDRMGGYPKEETKINEKI